MRILREFQADGRFGPEESQRYFEDPNPSPSVEIT